MDIALVKSIVENSRVPSTPGFGVAGMVMCPLMKMPCVKSACEFWVELMYAAGTPDANKVGRCAYAWQAILQAEGNQAINRLHETVKQLTPTADAPTHAQT